MTATLPDLETYARDLGRRARGASRVLAGLTGQVKNRWLKTAAERIRRDAAELIAANRMDVERAPEYGLTPAEVDRLTLNATRLEGIARALEELVMLPDPVGETIDSTIRPNGLRVARVRVPLGVVFFIYESRPNVTVDAAAICVKSGNAVILRGGKEAFHSNQAFHKLLSETLAACGLPADAVQLVATTDRAVVGHLLCLSEFIDVTIPRGGKSLIERVAREARMPVIKHFDGNCHVYIDESADFDMALSILINSKCQRTGVCNAAESLLVHAAVADRFLPLAAEALSGQGVELRCCDRSRPLMPGSGPVTEDDLRAEFLAPILSVMIVDSLDDAIAHINEYGSHHTDAIVTESLSAAERFRREVDSSAVMVNASTRFNDGGELGLGAEIGISTDKFHARGPCGLRELTSYKYLVDGTGQIRQ